MEVNGTKRKVKRWRATEEGGRKRNMLWEGDNRKETRKGRR